MASTARSYRVCTAAFERASASLEAASATLASRSPASARVTSAFACVCTASTVESPTTPAIKATAAEATAVRLRFAQRRARREIGSRQAETGSSAIHRSMSSARACGERITVRRPVRHRLQADRLQRPIDRRVVLPRRGEIAPLHGAEDLADLTLDRRPAGQ